LFNNDPYGHKKREKRIVVILIIIFIIMTVLGGWAAYIEKKELGALIDKMVHPPPSMNSEYSAPLKITVLMQTVESVKSKGNQFSS